MSKSDIDALEFIKTQARMIISLSASAILGFFAIALTVFFFYKNISPDVAAIAAASQVMVELQSADDDADAAKDISDEYLVDHNHELYSKYDIKMGSLREKLRKAEGLMHRIGDVKGSSRNHNSIADIASGISGMIVWMDTHQQQFDEVYQMHKKNNVVAEKEEEAKKLMNSTMSLYAAKYTSLSNMLGLLISNLDSGIDGKIRLFDIVIEILSAVVILVVGILGIRILRQYRQVLK